MKRAGVCASVAVCAGVYAGVCQPGGPESGSGCSICLASTPNTVSEPRMIAAAPAITFIFQPVGRHIPLKDASTNLVLMSHLLPECSHMTTASGQASWET